MPLAHLFEGTRGKRLLWLVGIVMLAFGAAELPALTEMSAHGTNVLGFEFAGTSGRLRALLAGWHAAGRSGAEEHVFIDLGFIVGYGLLLAGLCGRVAARAQERHHERLASAAALLAYGALIAAAVNVLQKVILWFELHGHTGQPLPALAATFGAITFAIAVPAALLGVIGSTAIGRREASAAMADGNARG